jgi:cytochrome P450
MASTLPPGPRGLPYFGVAFEFQRNQLAFITRLARDYGHIAGYSIMGYPLVCAARASAVRHVLIENARNFANREVYRSLVPLLGEGLLTIDGERHRRERRLVLPAFHKRRVESYAETMVAYTLDRIAGWRAGQALDLASEMQQLTLAVVAQALFHVDLRAGSAELGRAFTETVDYLNRLTTLNWGSVAIDLPFTPYGRFRRAKAVLDAAVYELIAARRREERDAGDVLSMLLAARDEDGSALGDTQIRDHAMTLLAAGHDTTSNALAWTFYLLSEHPEERAKLLGELEDVLGGRPPEVADLDRLPYLEQVVKESLRLYPPAWSMGRYALGEFELEGYRFAAGTLVFLAPWVTHRLPEYWSEPERFRPERFAEGEPRADFAYFPFGAGPRTCIGMPFAMLEARLLLATILQRFTPRLAPGAQVVPEPLITLRPRGGLPVVLETSPAPEPQRA